MPKISLTLITMVITFVITAPLDAQAKAAALDSEIPEDVQAACEKWGAAYDICPELLEAICYNESRYISTVENGTCKGLMQINTPYHKDRMKDCNVTDIFDIDSNIHVGADYLAELFKEHEDTAVVIGLYHGEPNAEAKAKKNQLSSYTTRILKKAASLEKAHGK